MKLKPLIVNPAAFYEVLLHPNFADISPDFNGSYTSTLSEFTLMDNVSFSRGTPILDIFKLQNFLKRKDRSCKTDWSKVARTANRKIKIDELYGAVEDCQEEFYAECLKDFRDQSPRFRDMILQIMKKGLNLDVLSNAYFGDMARPDDATGVWSWNIFDGIVVKIQGYIADSTIPAGQIMTALPSGTMTPTQAYNALKEAKDRMSDLMQTLPDLDLAIYIDNRFAKAYERYLIATGTNTTNGIMYIQDGVPVFNFEDTPIYIEKTWNPILKALNGGTEAHMLILTIRGNFVFGTNKTYGGGANLDQALRVWYSEDDDVWRYKMHLAGGTEIAMPEHIVFGITNIP